MLDRFAQKMHRVIAKQLLAQTGQFADGTPGRVQAQRSAVVARWITLRTHLRDSNIEGIRHQVLEIGVHAAEPDLQRDPASHCVIVCFGILQNH